MPRSLNTSALMKPLVVLALPGMYLFYKYNQYKRQQQEQDRRKVTERELAHLNHKIDKLLCKLEENEPEMATSQEDECVICVNARATMQTYPCGHRVVCRKCFVKTIQMAVSQRLLPLRCVICRSKILRLKQSSNGRSGSGVSTSGSILMPTSASQYSMMSPGSSHPNQWAVPNSASLFSMTSGSSSLSGMSSVSSATTSSQGSGKSLLSTSSVGTKSGIGKTGYRQPTGALKKSQAQSMKLRVQEIKEPRLHSAVSSGPSTSQGTSNKDRSTSPSSANGKGRAGNQNTASAPPRLPPIKEFQRDFRASKERASRDKATSASTRIRCAQKIVTQLEASPSIQSCPTAHSSKKVVASASTSYFRSHSPVKLGKKEKRKEKKRLKEEKKRAEAEAAAAAAAAAREKEKEKEKEKAEAKAKKEEASENAKAKKKEEKQGKKDKEKKDAKKD